MKHLASRQQLPDLESFDLSSDSTPLQAHFSLVGRLRMR